MPVVAGIKKDFLDLIIKKVSLRIASNTENMFVLKSGRKSPVFMNTGALTDGESLIGLKKAYSHFIFRLLQEGKIEKFDFIFGPAYKGISIACLACEGLAELGVNVRYLYDRKEIKDYGDKKADEVIVGAGHFTPGSKILLIDDVITTGGTKLDAIEKLKLLGGHKIVGLVLALDRQEKTGDAVNVESRSAVENIESLGIPCFSIINMSDLFLSVKDTLQDDVKQSWIEYYDRYGTVKLG